MSRNRKVEKSRPGSQSEAQNPQSRMPKRKVILIALAGVVGILLFSLWYFGISGARDAVAENDVREEPPKVTTVKGEKTESDSEIHDRLFPTKGYRVYPSAKDVDWVNILASDCEWNETQQRILSTAMTLVAETMGEDDPVVKELLLIGKGSRIKGIVPMDLNVAIGEALEERLYIDQMWSPLTGCIHVPRNRMGSLIQVASCLYHEGFHVGQVPNMEAARKADGRKIEIEAYNKQMLFNAKLKTLLETKFAKQPAQPRWLRELRLVNEECQRRILNYEKGRGPVIQLPRKR